MRLMHTQTGRKTHIVREGAWHGQDGTMLNGLCGAWINGTPWTPTPETAAIQAAYMCKTCDKLHKKGVR